MSQHDNALSWAREDRHMANDRERVAEFEAVLARFHASVGTDVSLWRESTDAGTALNAARELLDVYYELCLLYLQRIKRGEALRSHAREDSAPPLTPEQVQRARVTEAWERVDHELDRLRTMGVGADVVRRAEQERRARLLWLIDLLQTVMPEHAKTMRKDLLEPDASHSAVPANARFRRQRRMGDALLLFLEPLL